MTDRNQQSNASSRLRLPARWVALVVAALLSLQLWPAAWPALPLSAFSPFVAAGSAFATRTIGLVVLLGVPALVLTLVWRRWFCRNACPLGQLLDLVARLRKNGPRPWKHSPPVGRWLAVLTLAGAAVGYPLFLWLDPLAIFNGFFSAWRLPLTLASACAGITLPLVLLFELWQPRFWCARLCPLGGLQELLGWRGQRNATAPHHQWNAARRGFIAACVGVLGGAIARNAAAQPPPLRPPGSLDEDQFTGACVRCGNCTRVCPTRILHPDPGKHGLTGLLAPVMRFNSGYCQENCNRCNQVCPSGAIQRLPLAEKRRCVIGVAKVNLETCLLADGRECTVCIRACPYEALSVFTDGFDSHPKLELSKCTGCGACEVACPVRPQRAIRIYPEAGTLV